MYLCVVVAARHFLKIHFTYKISGRRSALFSKNKAEFFGGFEDFCSVEGLVVFFVCPCISWDTGTIPLFHPLLYLSQQRLPHRGTHVWSVCVCINVCRCVKKKKMCKRLCAWRGFMYVYMT